MGRSRASARQAGTRFERLIADTLAFHLADDRIDRRVKTGAKDKGDIANVRVHGQRLVIEAKDTSRPDLAGWQSEVEAERENDEALAGVIAHKRRGKGDGLDQWITMTVREFVAILDGSRPER